MKHKSSLLVLFGCMAALCPISEAHSGEAVAYVVDYSETDGQVAIRRRETEILPIEIGAPLEAGDVVEVSGSASATIEDGQGDVIVLLAAGSPLVIEGGDTFTAARGEYERIMEIVRWQAGEGSISARTRDSYNLAAPLLDIDAPTLKIVAGARDIPIGWIDGKPPFHWDLRAGGRVVAEQMVTSGRRTVLSGILESGPAELRVTDSVGTTSVFPVLVVDTPPAEAAEVMGRARSPLERIDAAAILSRIEGGAFILESVSLLSRPEATRAETAFRAALEIGERP